MTCSINCAKRNLTDAEIIDGLKNNDQAVVTYFLYEACNYALNNIRMSLMEGRVDYDDLANELYLHLAQDGWRRLDTFAGINNCKLSSWVARLAWNFFMGKRKELLGIAGVDVDERNVPDVSDDILDTEIAIDVDSTLGRMPNQRYASVLRMLLVDGYNYDEVAAALGTTVSNVYNIKCRAISQFVDTFE